MDNIILNVDSRFRNRTKYPNAAKYSYRMSEKIKNCKYIRMSSIEFPNLYYTFSKEKRNITFDITCTDIIPLCDPSNNTIDNLTRTITINEGMYDAESILLEIQAQLDKINVLACYKYRIIFNNISGHVKFTSEKSFTINFDNGYDPQNCQSILYPSLGHLLGFRQTLYLSIINTDYDEDLYECDKNVIYSECNLDVAGDTYLFLKINNYGVIYNDFEDVVVTTKNYMKDTYNIKDINKSDTINIIKMD
jgi:hypothetical protein